METDDATTHPKGPPATAGGPTLHLVTRPPDGRSRDGHSGAAVDDDAPIISPAVELVDRSAPWPVERIEELFDAFLHSPWGECLSYVARRALREALTATDTHDFRGSAGLPFLADCLRTPSFENYDEFTIEALRTLPVGLRQWVRFTDRLGNGVAPTATLTKLEYLDRLEPAWQGAVTRGSRRRHFDQPGLVARLRELGADVGAELPAEDPLMLDEAMDLVDDLSVDRLPDEPLQLEDLDPDAAVRVLEIGDQCDHFFRHAIHVELRTAARRLLVVVARRQPEALRRPTARSLAGGISYAVIRGNVSRIERHRPAGDVVDRSPARHQCIRRPLSRAGRWWPRRASSSPRTTRRSLRDCAPSHSVWATRTSSSRPDGWTSSITPRPSSIASSSASRERPPGRRARPIRCHTPCVGSSHVHDAGVGGPIGGRCGASPRADLIHRPRWSRPAHSLGAMAPDDADPTDAAAAVNGPPPTSPTSPTSPTISSSSSGAPPRPGSRSR